MKQKYFTIRVDLESEKGIKKGLPKLLKLFREENILASFYLTVGGESNIFELIKNNKKMTSAMERKIKVFSTKEKLRMVLLPTNFAKKNRPLLKRIIDEGHELGLHGYKHRRWTRNLENLNIEKEIKKMIKTYISLFKQIPVSFAAPGFNINERVITELEKNDILAISDFSEFRKIGKITNVPITLKGEHNTPFIEYWAGLGKTDEEILKIFREKIKGRDYVSFYIHGLYEGIEKIPLLKEMIKELKRQGYKDKRIIDLT